MNGVPKYVAETSYKYSLEKDILSRGHKEFLYMNSNEHEFIVKKYLLSAWGNKSYEWICRNKKWSQICKIDM